jgi:hypothetical protein
MSITYPIRCLVPITSEVIDAQTFRSNILRIPSPPAPGAGKQAERRMTDTSPGTA